MAAAAAGQGPTWANPNAAPSARYWHAAAFDEGRGRMVVFGGNDGTGPLNDTWEYDGSAWIRRTPATSPPASDRSTMAFDPVRGVMWLSMGSGPEFWLWNGETWTQGPSLPALPPDPQGLIHKRRVVWHGGTNPGPIVWQPPVGGSPGFTWRFDGTSWVVMGSYTGEPGPTAAYGPAAYVPATGMTYALDFTGALMRAWDGSAWQAVTLSGAPISLGLPDYDTCVWDAGLGRLVAHHTSSPTTTLTQFTAPLQGQVTSLQQQTTHDLYLARATLVHDTARHVNLLWGGSLSLSQAPPTVIYNDLWRSNLTYSTANWQRVAPLTSQPPARVYTDMAFEANTGRMVLCGGQGQSGALNDTWTFDGSTWTGHGPSATVSPRTQPALCHFPGVGTVLFGGGIHPTSYLNDTYVLAGTQWQVPNVLGAPPGRIGHDMVHAWNRLVVYGGYNGSTFGDCWSLNNNGSSLSWLPMLTIGSPGPRQSHAMAFDERRNCIVVFGGADANIIFLGDTWELTPAALGFQWVQRTTAHSPPRRWQHRMAYDPARGVVVMTGGYGDPQCGDYCASNLNDVWEYDGVDWQQRVPSTTLPSPREGSGFAYDSQRQRFVMQDGSGSVAFPSDTWYYTADNDTFADGMQGGGDFRLRCLDYPVAGQPTGFAFDTPYGFGWLTVYVGPAPGPGVTLGPGLLCGTGTFYGVPATAIVDAMGFPGTTRFHLPAAMAGQGFVVQGVSLEAGFCLRLTDPLAVTVHAP